MNRWRQRLAELHSDRAESPAAVSPAVQNVQNVQNPAPDETSEHFEQIEQPTQAAALSAPPAADRAFATWGEAEDTKHRPSEPPIWWQDQYAERAAMRQYAGGSPRAEAELLAWRDIENRWNLTHGERVSRALCAGCRRPIGTGETLDLVDGNRVHLADGYDCLIRHGERWRSAATQALVVLGIEPPSGVLVGE